VVEGAFDSLSFPHVSLRAVRYSQVPPQAKAPMKTAFVFLLAVALTLLSGVLHGRMSERWEQGIDFQPALAKLREMPARIGDWQMRDEEEFTDSVVEMLRCKGYVNRGYVNRRTGATLRVAILMGPAGPLSVHTPEICYSSRDYTQTGKRTKLSIPGTDGETQNFWVVAFQSTQLSGQHMNVYYAWHDGARWRAPEEPRLSFSGEQTLYKIQIAAGAELTTDPQRTSSTQFLKELLPWLQGNLVQLP